MSMQTKTWLSLAGFLLLSFGAGAIGAAFPPGDWYAGLDKPSWNPPNWLFGPVWTTLYIMIGVAGWRIFQRVERVPSAELAAWGVQLVLNAMWSWLFFGLKLTGVALVEILLLWGAILTTLLLFRRRDKVASWLMAPYLAWVSFASLLNFELWRLNG